MLTRVVKRFDQERLTEDERLRFCEWIALCGFNPHDVSAWGAVVTKSRGRLALSVHEVVKGADGYAQVRGNRIATSRRSVRIDNLPRWVEAL